MPQRIGLLAFALLTALLTVLLSHTGGDERKGASNGKEPSSAIRVPWKTSRVRGSPEPPSPYKTEIAFPKLKFEEPLDITSAPDGDRLFVTERFGRIFSFRTDSQTERADLLLDMNQVLGRTEPRSLVVYGFTPHPQFARNGFVYVAYVPDLTRELPKGSRVSRFHVLPGDPLRCDPKSERVIFEWPSGGHNGGCLKFGPDGFLYIGTGDASGIADQNLTGQDLGSLAGKILRIDVDNSEPGKAYAIPKDNPFVSVKGVRPEIWAYGLRQPWKMSFDPATGDLWTGNVGQDLWEQIYRIERGGNYGWSVQEGSHPFRPERPRGPSSILMPIVEHDHANFRSITGGFIYHGRRLKELQGSYIYGDYDTGRIWMFRYDSQKKVVSDHRELFKSNLRLVCFGEDNSGELYLLDHMGGRISRLVPNPAANTAGQFPRRLSETGLFLSTREHRLAPGVLPYEIIAPQWCDGASKERFLALPDLSQIDFEVITYPQPAPGASPGWRFPDGTVIAETLFVETEAGKPGGRHRIETRLLHNEKLTGNEEVGDQYWHGYTYIWNDEQTDAVLLEDPQGRDAVLTIRDPRASGGKRQVSWHFPSRTECTVCHNTAAKYILGVQTLQVNCTQGSPAANQLRTLEQLGLFTKPLPSPPAEMPRLVDYRDAAQDLDLRARSYLHSNCSHCHRKWGGGNAEFQLLASLDLTDTGAAGTRPGQGTFNIANARVIAPHDPYRSVLFYRMAKRGPGRMPRIGSDEVDEAGLNLIHDWIAHLPGAGVVSDASVRHAADTAAAIDRLCKTKGTSAEELRPLIDPLLASTNTALRLMRAVDEGALSADVREAVVTRAAQSESVEVRDLFERFLPEEKRVKRLGNVIRPETILALRGDVSRGRKLFFEAPGVQCRNCHRVEGKGTEVGPDLDQIGKKYDRAAILDNILFPSKQIDEKYLTHLIETKQGRVHTGILVSKDANKVILKDANNKQIEVTAGDIELQTTQQKSLMPDLLLRDLTADQVADLTAFLSSLK
ncbi:MAG TPA: PQQ-dependent sugar dehydrogenase [Gemmataceae bacterium]|jgi:putative heme-binding domain-containing protein